LPSLKKLTRDKLNDRARALGIDAIPLATRRDVIEAIEERQHRFSGLTSPDLYQFGARVLRVHGEVVVLTVPRDLAEYLFKQPLRHAGPTTLSEAAERDIAKIRERDSAVGESVIAASVVSMAHEVDDPFNSSTSKAQCAKELRQSYDSLLEQSPAPPAEESELERLRRARATRREAA
jgi:hypothetical protein